MENIVSIFWRFGKSVFNLMAWASMDPLNSWKIYFSFSDVSANLFFVPSTSQVQPGALRALRRLGENIRLARKRRGLTATLVAERAGMSRPTLRALEHGEPTVTLASLANVLHCLGLEAGLAELAADDDLGRHLQDALLEPNKKRR